MDKSVNLIERANIFYPEHLRRVKEARYSAKRVRYIYPLVSAFLFGVPFLFATVAVKTIYHLPNSRFKEFLPTDSHIVMPVLYSVTIAVFVGAFFLGLFLGYSHARNLLFKAEGYELSLRQELFSSKIVSALDGFSDEKQGMKL